MISVVIPTLNAGQTLTEALAALIPAAVDGLVREVVVADGGSADDTFAIAEDAGARFVAAAGDRAALVTAGCAVAKGPWLLILHPQMRVGTEWMTAAKAHLADHPRAAGYFRLALDDHRATARLKEAGAALGGLMGWPNAEQGLLTPKRLYEEAGAYGAEGTLVRRIGKARLRPLPARVFRVG